VTKSPRIRKRREETVLRLLTKRFAFLKEKIGSKMHSRKTLRGLLKASYIKVTEQAHFKFDHYAVGPVLLRQITVIDSLNDRHVTDR